MRRAGPVKPPATSRGRGISLGSGPHHLQETVLGEVGIAGVVEGAGIGPCQPDALVELADGQQPGVAEESDRRWLNDERRAEEVQDLRPGGWYTHHRSRGCGTNRLERFNEVVPRD